MEEGFLDGSEQPYSVMPPQYKDEKESPEIGIIRELSPRKVLEQLEMNLRNILKKIILNH